MTSEFLYAKVVFIGLNACYDGVTNEIGGSYMLVFFGFRALLCILSII